MSGREVVRVFEKLGWQNVRQRASHIILAKEGARATLSVPDHKEVARGTLPSTSSIEPQTELGDAAFEKFLVAQ